MKNRTSLGVASGVIIAIVWPSALGCAGGPMPEAALVNGPTFEEQSALVAGVPFAPKRVRFRRHLPPDDASFDMHLPPFDVSDKPGAAVWGEQKAQMERNLADSGWEQHTPEGKSRIIFVDENNDEWEEEYDVADLHALRELGEQRGINRASHYDGAYEEPLLSPGVKPQGWSNGTDVRFGKPINATYPNTHNILMRMGHLQTNVNGGSGQCTATLVGRRLVLTAAHCVVNSSGQVPTSSGLYSPRRSGATMPWGQEPNNGKWFDAEYVNNNCHITYTAATRETCGKYDWMLLRLNTNPWQTPGAPGPISWMGYWVPGSSGWLARNDGYGACGGASSPCANGNCVCADQVIYGEGQGHSVINFRGVVNGETTIYNSANDVSPGHSGGAIWSNSYPDSTGGPYVLGIWTNEMCGTCTESWLAPEDKSHPAMSRRMTAALAGLITDKRAQYP